MRLKVSQKVYCVSESVHSPGLVYGNQYEVIDINPNKQLVCISNEHGKERWYPASCFEELEQPPISIDSWICDDDDFMPFCDITITLNDGTQRWCIMATPEHLATSGETHPINETIRWHEPCAHLFIVNHITTEVVEHILQQTLRQGRLIDSTVLLPSNNPEILYVEDHQVFAQNVMTMLLSDHDIDWVENIEAAKQAWTHNNGGYALVLCDYDLPDGKGTEFVRWLRQQDQHIHIIANSAHDAGNQKLIEAGATTICSKMKVSTQLPALVESILF